MKEDINTFISAIYIERYDSIKSWYLTNTNLSNEYMLQVGKQNYVRKNIDILQRIVTERFDFLLKKYCAGNADCFISITQLLSLELFAFKADL